MPGNKVAEHLTRTPPARPLWSPQEVVYILGQAGALGLPAEVQRAEVGPGRIAENVIVRLPGTANSSRDVLITAHYDSTPNSPGAEDNGVSVAAMLETMRVLEAGEPLERVMNSSENRISMQFLRVVWSLAIPRFPVRGDHLRRGRSRRGSRRPLPAKSSS